MQISDHRQRPLLCARRERPSRRRAAEKVNELTSPHFRTRGQRPVIVSAQTRKSIGLKLSIKTTAAVHSPMSKMGHFRQIDPLPNALGCGSSSLFSDDPSLIGTHQIVADWFIQIVADWFIETQCEG